MDKSASRLIHNFKLSVMKISRYLILIIAFAIFYNFNTNAQVVGFDAQVKEYGQLKSVLGENWDKIDSLVVSGPINATDFRTMWECAFYGKLTVLNLENVQIENNTIPTDAFFDVDKQVWEPGEIIYLNIRKIILPDNITKIGFRAFYRMKLEKINLPSSLRELSTGSFGSCHWLSVDPLIIPEGIIEIPHQCFINCQSFKKLVLPSTLKVIRSHAFMNTRMEEVVFPDGLEYIASAAFEGSGELKKAILPNSCKYLDDFVFSMCDSLKELRIPEGITRIPENFASYCNILEKVNIPNSVEEIGEMAFQWCFILKDIKLPEGIKRIGWLAFAHCEPDSVVFPESLEYLGGNSCRHWENIQKIYSKSPNPPFCDDDPSNIGHYSFGETPKDIPVYVPIGSAELYRNAQGWSKFSNIIETDDFPDSGIYGIKTDAPLASKVYWSSGYLNIELFDMPDKPITYAIYTLEGRLVESGKLNSLNFSTQLPKGFYIVQVGKDVHKVM